MDLIDRKALLERMRENASFATSYKPYMTKEDIAFHVLKDAKEQALMFVEEAPTIEAAPVVHGEWIHGEFDENHHWVKGSKHVRCSECWRVFDSDSLNIWHWCPQCGAKMDGK